MLKLIRSTKFDGVYCKEHRFHYVLQGKAPNQNIGAAKKLFTVSYCFFRGKWYQDIAYISAGSLREIIGFADKHCISVHKSYRELINIL
jgi:hypothetical protein